MSLVLQADYIVGFIGKSAHEQHDHAYLLAYTVMYLVVCRSQQADTGAKGPITGFAELPGWLSDSKLVRAYR